MCHLPCLSLPSLSLSLSVSLSLSLSLSPSLPPLLPVLEPSAHIQNLNRAYRQFRDVLPIKVRVMCVHRTGADSTDTGLMVAVTVAVARHPPRLHNVYHICTHTTLPARGRGEADSGGEVTGISGVVTWEKPQCGGHCLVIVVLPRISLLFCSADSVTLSPRWVHLRFTWLWT